MNSMKVVNARNNLFDNIKGVTILLVVLGHAFEWYRDYLPIQYVYLCIYSFHMPLFLFVSGYFSKSEHAGREALTKLLPTYILLEVVYSVFLFVATGEASFSLLTPQSAFWYLVAIIVYRIVLIKFSKTPKIVWGLFAIGLIVGFDSSTMNGVLSLQRLISLSGFFMLGYFTTKKNIETLREKRMLGLGMLFLAFVVMAIWYKCNPIFGMDIGFRDVYVNPWGWVGRLLHYCIGILMTYATVIVMTEKRTIFCKLGQNSFTIYLLHIFFVGAIRVINPFVDNPFLNFTFLTMVTILLVFTLSSRPVVELFEKLVNCLSKMMSRIVKQEEVMDGKFEDI